jgi:hypothetical protein
VENYLSNHRFSPLETTHRTMLTVSTHDGSVPAPYIVNKLNRGYGVAYYSHKVILTNGKRGWQYQQLAYDGVIAEFKTRKAARSQGDYMIGF